MRWGLGGLRHFRGALRPSRHSSRGLPTGSAIRCHSSPSCAGAYDSGFVGPRLLDVATGGVWDSFVLQRFAPQDFGMLGVFCARFPPREASISNYSANDNDKIKSKSSSVSLLQRFAMSRHLHRISKVRTFRKAQETYFKINLDGMCRIDHLTNKIYR